MARKEFTPMQYLVIRNISSMFHDREKLEAISDEYREIYKSELKDDYDWWQKRIVEFRGNWKDI